MKKTYYSVRTVIASSKKEAIKKIENGEFDETDALCDIVFSQKEIEKQFETTFPLPKGRNK